MQLFEKQHLNITSERKKPYHADQPSRIPYHLSNI